jgi:hypothetical protein
MTVVGRMGWPEAEVVQGITASRIGDYAAAGGLQSSDFAEVERAWIKALREVGFQLP